MNTVYTNKYFSPEKATRGLRERMAALAVLLKTAPAVDGMLFPVDRKSMTVQYIYILKLTVKKY